LRLTHVIPASQEAEIGSIAVQGQPGQHKVSKTPSQQISWTWWHLSPHTCVPIPAILAMQGHREEDCKARLYLNNKIKIIIIIIKG
jgi:hypothetical protein